MDLRYWYALDQHVNPLGFGCWQLSGKYFVNGKPRGWRDVSESEAVKIIHRALEEGVEFFDTAAAYGKGRSEEVLGKAFSSSTYKKKPVVCTKIVLNDQELSDQKLGPSFKEKVDDSLKRLRAEHIDILLLHNPIDTISWNDFDRSVLSDLVEQGKIRTYGVSCRSLQGVHAVLDANFGTCVEWVFNLIERRPVEEVFPKLQTKRINFIARSPLARGLISNQYLQGDLPRFSDHDFRKNLSEDWISWAVSSIKKLKTLETQVGDISNFGLEYCLWFNEVSAVIPGINSQTYLDKVLTLKNKGKMDPSVIKEIDQILPKNYPDW